ncbi:MAG TPA: helix-turn-helix domain-containing protein [Steroidobacteraceae bacterium]
MRKARPAVKPKLAAGTRRRGRPRADAAHAVPEERVLDLAFRTFAERGYDGTTLRALAKRLGVSHNLLNVRFGTKAELWRRAVDARVAVAAPPVYAALDARGVDDETRLRGFVHRFCRWALENPDLVGITNVECRHASWRLDYIVDAYLLPFKQRLDGLMERLGRVRPLRPLSTPALMSILVQGVGFYFASRPMLERIGAAHEISAAGLPGQMLAFTDFILAGLLPASNGDSGMVAPDTGDGRIRAKAPVRFAAGDPQ